MKTVTFAEAQAQLGLLLELVEAGDEVIITKDGLPIARMIASLASGQQLPDLSGFRSRQPEQTESAGDFMRRLRDGERY